MVDVAAIVLGYVPLIGTLAMIMVGYMLLTYLASRILKIPEWEAYLNIELSELIVSLIIVMAAVGFFVASDAIAGNFAENVVRSTVSSAPGGSGAADGGTAALASSPRATHVAIDFLRSILDDGSGHGIEAGINDVFQLQVCLSILNQIQRRVGEFVLTVTYKLFPGVDAVMSVINVVGYGLVASFGSISAQILILTFIDSIMPNFVLPAGIILRFFPPTREAGAFLIALAISFYAIYPTLYIIDEQIFKELGFDQNGDGRIEFYVKPGLDITSSWRHELGMDVQGEGAKYPTVYSMCIGKYIFFGVFSTELLEKLPNFMGVSTVLRGGFNNIFSEPFLNMITPIQFTTVLKSLALLSIPTLFIPALTTTITFASVNALTKTILAKGG